VPSPGQGRLFHTHSTVMATRKVGSKDVPGTKSMLSTSTRGSGFSHGVWFEIGAILLSYSTVIAITAGEQALIVDWNSRLSISTSGRGLA
jgi:hypothetical protein